DYTRYRGKPRRNHDPDRAPSVDRTACRSHLRAGAGRHRRVRPPRRTAGEQGPVLCHVAAAGGGRKRAKRLAEIITSFDLVGNICRQERHPCKERTTVKTVRCFAACGVHNRPPAIQSSGHSTDVSACMSSESKAFLSSTVMAVSGTRGPNTNAHK